MKPSSAKNKGRLHQQWVRDLILKVCPSLETADVVSTSMGCNGEDVQLSPAARKLLPLSIECKSKSRMALFQWMEQAESNAPKGAEPIVVAKANRKKPVVVVDAEYFFKHYYPRPLKRRK